MTFLQLIEQRGMPSRFARFCCGELKEYKIHNRAIQGIRRSESRKRSERYKEPEFCRSYPHKEKVRIYLPILEWSNEDVERFIEDRGIKCHPLYYDGAGNFHVEKRLGCIGCPLASIKKRREEYMHYPLMLKAHIKATEKYRENHPNSSNARKFRNVYDFFYGILFYKTLRDYYYDNEGLIFPRNSRAILENYFQIDLTI